jgi:hypothetical protein
VGQAGRQGEPGRGLCLSTGLARIPAALRKADPRRTRRLSTRNSARASLISQVDGSSPPSIANAWRSQRVEVVFAAFSTPAVRRRKGVA